MLNISEYSGAKYLLYFNFQEVKTKQTDAERIEEVKQAILNGLQIVDEFYEKVEIPDSDSEDDIDEPSVVFQPIDKYADRPLPYVIGSTEWHKHWHVGLIESSSDSEVENQIEEFSESESDQEINNLPVRDRSQVCIKYCENIKISCVNIFLNIIL